MAAKKKATKKKAAKKKAPAKKTSSATTAKPKTKKADIGPVGKYTLPKAEPKKKKADIREVGKYALLLTQKLDAEDTVKKINASIAKLFPDVLDYFQRQGIDQIAAEGRTLYLRREVHTNKATDYTTAEACSRLRSMDLEEYAGQRVNIQGLSTYVRNLEEEGQELKEIEDDFRGAFKVVELFKIGSRKR